MENAETELEAGYFRRDSKGSVRENVEASRERLKSLDGEVCGFAWVKVGYCPTQ